MIAKLVIFILEQPVLFFFILYFINGLTSALISLFLVNEFDAMELNKNEKFILFIIVLSLYPFLILYLLLHRIPEIVRALVFR